MNCTKLQEYRQEVYKCFGSSKDALMNLADALCTEVCAKSLPELSLSPFFDRKWPSIYEALEDGSIDTDALVQVNMKFAPDNRIDGYYPIGLDTSNIYRTYTDISKDRTNLHAPDGSIRPGWQYSSVVVLPESASSWTYSLHNKRVDVQSKPSLTAKDQLESIIKYLPDDSLVIGDRYYGSAEFISFIKDMPCNCLIRIQKHRVFYKPAPPKTSKRGRPRKHGDIFKCSDQSTQGEPDQVSVYTDETGKECKVSIWSGFHYKLCPDASLYIIKVERHNAKGTKRDPIVSWFIWKGELPKIESIPPVYKIRFSHEHAFKFDKRNLLWDKPMLKTPEQNDIWTQIVSIAHNMIVIAREFGESISRPWNNSARPATPEQVRRVMSKIIGDSGTPALSCQPRGKSPGWPKGKKRTPAERYRVHKKGNKSSETAPSKAA